MHLILLRHADAVDGPDDLKRELSKKGRQQAKLMAKWLKPRLDFDYEVWVSQAVRSVETAGYITGKPIIKKEINPSCTSSDVVRQIDATLYEKNLVICGHQPWISRVGLYYLEANKINMHINFKKAGLLWIEVTREGNYLERQLRTFITPQDLI